MTEMLAGIEGVIIYIDDIVVAGRTLQEHDERLREVLAVLERNNTMLNRGKCIIRVQELEILGFKVSAHGISPSAEKVQAIKNFRKPETKEEVRSFLGLMNFVGHFIPHLSTRSEPLRKYLRGEIATFGLEQAQAFDDLRNELSNHVRKLGFFDPRETTELYVDASPVGLGAVLVQRDSNNTPRIVSFASKGLTVSERVYPQTQREALAVVWAVEKFFFYLFGLHFTLYTDHKTLEYIYGGKHQIGKRACSRAEGWALRLQPYDFGVEYLPGTDNISDPLSRLVNQEDPAFDDNAEHYLLAVGEGPAAITFNEIRRETSNDDNLSAIMKALETGEWPPELFRYQAFDKELGVVDGMLIRGERIILPVKLRARALEIAHRGHPGVVSMRRNLRERVWWPCMDRDVKDNIQQCRGCAVVSKQNPPEPMQRKQMPERAWQEIAVDFFTAKECATFLVVIDYYSRFLKVIEMKTTTAAKTIEALESVFGEQTYPEVIRSDNGPPFASEEFRNYCLSKNVRLNHTIPYWPQMNGLVERSNQGILRTLRIAKASGTDWRTALQEFVHVYNRTPHSVTEKAPLELLLGRPVKDLLPSLRTEPGSYRDEGVRDMDAMKKAKGKLYADKHRHAKPSDIKVGDSVMVKNYDSGKLEPNFRSERFTVIKRSENDVVIESENGVRYRRCVTHLRKWPLETSSDNPNPEAEPTEGDKKSESTDIEEQTVKRPKHSCDDHVKGVMRRAGFNLRGTIFSKSNQFICFADDMDIVGRTFKAVADAYTGLKREAEKCSIYKSLIRPVVLYGHETWTMLEEDIRALSVFERRVLRTIFGGVYENDGWRRRMNHELAQLYNEPSIRKVAKAGRLQWAGHVARMPERTEQLSQRNQKINPAKLVFVSEPVGTRRRGVQRARWVDQVESDLESVGAPRNWRHAAMDRACWRRIVQQAKLMV
ncbi:uncharacterized protein K02A2.6-like [Culex pipiens pallens]|uniref:uncharacterized protein K02A2.6-like n=1 Tax=Culex pipiens pallens TaxID=42434 RepID=UPI001954C815|nr:uncharacterized protein K02A2.6-like [Culex pipiens pallens]